MTNSDDENLEVILEDIAEDIHNNRFAQANSRRLWLSSVAFSTKNKDLIFIEGIIGVMLNRFAGFIDVMESIASNPAANEIQFNETELTDSINLAISIFENIINDSKDYLIEKNITNFCDSVSHNYFAFQDLTESLRLEVG